jgi:hypothetical protein
MADAFGPLLVSKRTALAEEASWDDAIFGNEFFDLHQAVSKGHIRKVRKIRWVNTRAGSSPAVRTSEMGLSLDREGLSCICSMLHMSYVFPFRTG